MFKALTMVKKKVDKVYYGKSDLFTLTFCSAFHDSIVSSNVKLVADENKYRYSLSCA